MSGWRPFWKPAACARSSARSRAPPTRWCSKACGAPARSSSKSCRRAPWRSACARPGAGIPAFYTPTAVGTKLADGKEQRDIGGRAYLLEEALPGDVALVEAWEADRWGNLTYRSSARNFNPVMATAAKLTIVQSQHIVELGALDPEKVATPGIYVNRVLHVPYGEPTVT
jgi:acyl CoA:acetate/3-ketoacid CoA transferase alpha subunit